MATTMFHRQEWHKTNQSVEEWNDKWTKTVYLCHYHLPTEP